MLGGSASQNNLLGTLDLGPAGALISVPGLFCIRPIAASCSRDKTLCEASVLVLERSGDVVSGFSTALAGERAEDDDVVD